MFKLVSQAHHLADRVVLVRLETNVPLRGKKVVDDSRLREAIPTIRFLLRRGARLILLGHLGRPHGKYSAKLSLKPIGYALGKLLKQPVKIMEFKRGRDAIRRAAQTSIVLLENIRFEPGEDENSRELAKHLASLGDLYVNEVFSTSHHAAASIVGITRHLPPYAGFALAQEVAALERVRKVGSKPVVLVVGGAKVADKLPVISKLLPRVSAVLVGGAVANTFLLARGYKVGKSLVDRSVLKEARRILRQAKNKIILPLDVIVDKVVTKRHESIWREVNKVKPNESIVDIGTRTTQKFAPYLKQAQTVFWSGPLGLVEEPAWRHGTESLARLASARARGPAYVLVGGGDTVAFFHEKKLWVDHASLAGGAMLQFLAGEKLPGLTALGYR